MAHVQNKTIQERFRCLIFAQGGPRVSRCADKPYRVIRNLPLVCLGERGAMYHSFAVACAP
jgi:hypothetical protein